MEKIASFNVNHLNLLPGIYESRRDDVSNQSIISYDIRVTQPNVEPVLNTAEIHTIEHLAATYLRNHVKYKYRVIYFGPMGCRTGFYLILVGEDNYMELKKLIVELFSFIVNFNDLVPGLSAHDCGNYLDHNLPMAKVVSQQFLSRLMNSNSTSFAYHQ